MSNLRGGMTDTLNTVCIYVIMHMYVHIRMLTVYIYLLNLRFIR